MSKLRSFSLIGALCVSLGAPAMAQDTATADTTTADAGTVLATVNGTDITLGHMIALSQRLPEQYRQLPDQVLFDGLLEQLIQQTALGQTIDRMDRRAELILENEKRALLAGEVIENVSNAEISNEDLQAAYDAAYQSAEPETEYQASHILVETEDEAKAVIEDLNNGADFAELAKTKSTGPSGPNGGELGWFSAGMMVPEFEEAVATMAVNDISEPVQTQFGWHVIKLTDSREKAAPSLDEVRDQLTDQLRQQAVEKKVNDVTAEAEITRAEIEGMDPGVLRDGSLLDD